MWEGVPNEANSEADSIERDLCAVIAMRSAFGRECGIESGIRQVISQN